MTHDREIYVYIGSSVNVGKINCRHVRYGEGGAYVMEMDRRCYTSGVGGAIILGDGSNIILRRVRNCELNT